METIEGIQEFITANDWVVRAVAAYKKDGRGSSTRELKRLERDEN